MTMLLGDSIHGKEGEMRILIGLACGLAGTVGAIFADIKLAHWLFGMVPECAWAGLITVGIGLLLITQTAGLVLIPIVIGLAIGAAFEK